MAPSAKSSKRSAPAATAPSKKVKTNGKKQAPVESESEVSSDSSDISDSSQDELDSEEDELDDMEVDRKDEESEEDELDDLDEEKSNQDEEGSGDEDEEKTVSKEVDPNKKSSAEQHAEQRKLLADRKLKRKSGNEVQQIKSLWEKLRVKKPAPPKVVRDKLSNEIWELAKDVILDLVMKHDASRVVQTLVKFSSREKREIITKELKGNFYQLATSSYGKYLLVKLLHYGSKESRALIVDELHGKLRKLMRHKEGAYVVEDLYVLYSSAEQKHQMIREFWGAEYAVFKDSGKGKSVVDITKESAEKKQLITTNLYGTISASVEKGSTGFQILHAAMKEYTDILIDDIEANEPKIREFIELLNEQFAELVHTQEGSEVACTLLALATAKERKVIIRSLKNHIKELVKNEHGNLVLITLYITVDDTVLVHKSLNVEAFDDESIPSIISDKFARRPLIYLMKGLDGKYFNPKVKKDLEKYEKLAYAKTSKKPKDQKREELLSKALPLIYKSILATTNTEDIDNRFDKLISVNIASQFITELILTPTDDDSINEMKKQLLDSIFDVCIKGDVLEDYHIINKTPFVARALKSLIQGDQFKWDFESKKLKVTNKNNIPGVGVEFASKIANEIMENNKLADWVSGSGSFVIVAVFEVLQISKSPEFKKLEKELKKNKKTLQADTDNKGAQLLLKILG
ncbi:Puf family RNA-binding protein [Hyphopichia burtonii NRRL Y-1933]|uniref:Puf family RNA-binding protein n=1 Tax=Hyphopichia burtonii NRRL Y-1933 TaxID=984485 RepID=A0A1E4RCG3_9ASCO|nr:Puf family RNA-binding protein [Hyphopichia burtonii NRRL Y-1933]ODV64913.1 Puf family RNA-binding protein [Hyphopichia burtonii NRRL Y-1933]